MKRVRLTVGICAALLGLALLIGMAGPISGRLPSAYAQTGREALLASGESATSRAAAAFQGAEPIYDALRDLVANELAESDDMDSAYDVDVADGVLRKLEGFMKQLDDLSASLGGLPDSLDDSEGKTVRAVKDYLSMLHNMVFDIHALVDYSMDLYAALIVIAEMDVDVETYADLAEVIYVSTSEAIEILAQVKAPAYLAISHGDLEARIKEFQEFAVDFYVATELGDPLRIYSCIYRMNRIEIMFTQCGDTLDEDIMLQFTQADRRLEGTIATLRSELLQNLSLLGAA